MCSTILSSWKASLFILKSKSGNNYCLNRIGWNYIRHSIWSNMFYKYRVTALRITFHLGCIIIQSSNCKFKKRIVVNFKLFLSNFDRPIILKKAPSGIHDLQLYNLIYFALQDQFISRTINSYCISSNFHSLYICRMGWLESRPA